MRANKERKQLGSKRVDISLKDKQEYCRMITYGQPYKAIRSAYMKKYKKDLHRSTYKRWKKDAEVILSAGKKRGEACRHSYKLSVIKEEFDRDLMNKIEDSTIDLEGYQGLRDMAVELSTSKKFKDEDEIKNRTFTAVFML